MYCIVLNALLISINIIMSLYIICIHYKSTPLVLIHLSGLCIPYVQYMGESYLNDRFVTLSAIGCCSFIVFIYMSLQIVNDIRVLCKVIWLVAIVTSAISDKVFINDIPIIPTNMSDISILVCCSAFSILFISKLCNSRNTVRELKLIPSFAIQFLLIIAALSYRIDDFLPDKFKYIILRVCQVLVLILVFMFKFWCTHNLCWLPPESHNSDHELHTPGTDFQSQTTSVTSFEV